MNELLFYLSPQGPILPREAYIGAAWLQSRDSQLWAELGPSSSCNRAFGKSGKKERKGGGAKRKGRGEDLNYSHRSPIPWICSVS